MTPQRVPEDAPEDFRRAVAALRAVRWRPEVVLEEAPAPQRIAPWGMTLDAEVLPASAGGGRRGGGDAHRPASQLDAAEEDEAIATGRFVLLHDPAGQAAWAGSFRAVTLVRARLEPELAADPLVGAVGWAWLVEALDERGARTSNAGGTVTRVASESFGALVERASTVEVEIRASWTPGGPDLEPHLSAWGDLLCTVAGLPPLPDGVAPLHVHRR